MNGPEADDPVATGANPTIEDFHVEACGRPLAARWIGRPPGDAPVRRPIVMLHEGLGCTGMWGDFPQALHGATGLPVLLYDRMGHGGSGPVTRARPTDFMTREALDVLPAVLAACRVEEPLLFGHSDGGTVALIHAAHHDVPALVTEAAHIFTDELTAGGLAKTRAMWKSGKLGGFLQPFHGAATAPLVAAWLDVWQRSRAEGWSVEAELSGITAPLVAIQGSTDEYGLPAQLDGIVSGVSGPAEKHFLEGVGHSPHLSHPEIVLGIVAPFLRRAAAP